MSEAPPQTPEPRPLSDGAIRVRRALISVSDKTGDRRLRQGLAALGRRDPLDRRHRGGAARGGARGDRRLRVHRPGGDPRRPGEDAAPAAARGAARAARRPRAHGDPGARGDRADRPGLRQPLPLRGDRRRRTRSTPEVAIENIDIGGPTMIRAAAKNHQRRRGRRQAGVLRRGARRAGGVRRRDLRLDPPLAGQRGLRPDRPLRRRDQPLVLDRVRGLPRAPGRRLREGARPLLRREPAPAGGALLRGRRPQPRPLAASRSCTAGRSPSTTSSTSTRRGAWSSDFERAGLHDRQAQQPLRGGGRRGRARRLRQGARLRPDVGLRRRDRPQPAGRRASWPRRCTRTSSRC